MHSVLITNPEGKILLSRYFETQNDGPDYAYADYDADAAGDAAGSDITLRKGGEGGSIMRDRAMAMCSSESEVLGQTRHLWTKGTAECPQVARAKVWRCSQDFFCHCNICAGIRMHSYVSLRADREVQISDGAKTCASTRV